MYIYVDSVDDLFERATTAGATTDTKPEDTFWGDRMCGVFDPDGHLWCFAAKIQK